LIQGDHVIITNQQVLPLLAAQWKYERYIIITLSFVNWFRIMRVLRMTYRITYIRTCI